MGTAFVEFRQLQEVGIFSYLVYSLAKSHFYGLDAWMAVLSVSKIFEPSEEIPTCVIGFTVHMNCFVIFVWFG